MRRRVAAAAMALCTCGGVVAVPAGAQQAPSQPVYPQPVSTQPVSTQPASSGTADGSPGLTYTYRSESLPSGTGARVGRSSARSGAPPEAHARAPSEATPGAARFVAPRNDDFVLHFSHVSKPQQAVFDAAAGIWSDVLEVEVPIDVRVTTTSFSDPGILGGAEPTDLHANHLSFPRTDVWFVPAQANQYAGRDLDPTQPEIEIVISSDFDFYEGIDDDVPVDQTSLLNLALHEFGHGLGHITLGRQSGASWTITSPTAAGTPLPLAYDTLLQDVSGKPLTSLSSAALGAALTSRVLWSGAEATAADGDMRPEIYAPSSFLPGSSTSHLDEAWYPDGLMTPSISDGEARLEIPWLTQAMFADFGWGLEVSGRAESYVTALSRDFLSGFPTPSELDALVSELRRGTPRREIVTRFATSDEYLGRLVDTYYLATLGRPADAAGKQHWLRQLRSGRTPASVAAGFYASPEYFRLAGNSTRSWIIDLYAQILGREPDPAGLATWMGKAAAGASRSDIAFAFHQSVESRSRRVSLLYHHFLGRAPDPAGLAHWREVLVDGRDIHLAVELARSPEYRNRAVRRYG